MKSIFSLFFVATFITCFSIVTCDARVKNARKFNIRHYLEQKPNNATPKMSANTLKETANLLTPQLLWQANGNENDIVDKSLRNLLNDLVDTSDYVMESEDSHFIGKGNSPAIAKQKKIFYCGLAVVSLVFGLGMLYMMVLVYQYKKLIKYHELMKSEKSQNQP